MYRPEGPVITIWVGEEPSIPFQIHKKLLCSSADYFERLINGPWKNVSSDSLSLKKQDPATFAIYEFFLHYRFVRVLAGGSSEVEDSKENILGRHAWDGSEFTRLVKAYILGDFLLASDFKDCTLDAMRLLTVDPDKNGVKGFPDSSAINEIYNNTLDGSNARKFLVDLYIQQGPPEWMTNDQGPNGFHQGFLLGCAAALLDWIEGCRRSRECLSRERLCPSQSADSTRCYDETSSELVAKYVVATLLAHPDLMGNDQDPDGLQEYLFNCTVGLLERMHNHITGRTLLTGVCYYHEHPAGSTTCYRKAF